MSSWTGRYLRRERSGGWPRRPASAPGCGTRARRQMHRRGGEIERNLRENVGNTEAVAGEKLRMIERRVEHAETMCDSGLLTLRDRRNLPRAGGPHGVSVFPHGQHWLKEG